MTTPRLLLLLVAALFLGPPVHAEEEEPGGDPGEKAAAAVVRRIVDLPRYRVPPAPKGPRLSVPTDLIAQTGDPHDVNNWLLDEVSESGTWLPFAEPSSESWTLALDNVIELLQALHASDGESAVDLGTTERGIELEGPRAEVEAVLARLPWVLEALAPSLDVRAALFCRTGTQAERLCAMGRVRLWPNRWTRVYLQEDAVPCTVHWALEVAQESTTMDPSPVDASHGQELYLRYHPGQHVSLVEVWSGETHHLRLVKQDLSKVRNIPEANGPGVLSYPETAVNRVFTALALRSGEAARRSLRWSNQGRDSRLALAFSAPPLPQRPMTTREGQALASLRVAAVGDELEFGARPGTTGEQENRMSRLLYRLGEAYEKRGQSFDFTLSSVADGAMFVIEAPPQALPRVRALLDEDEARLTTREVALRILTVPEPAFRKALLEGALEIGGALPESLAASFAKAGATVGESVQMPALLQMRVGIRVGHTVPGVTDFSTEIAQSSGGVQPLTSVRFAGLLGELHVRRTPAGHALRVSGRISWADRAAGVMEMVFRPPVGMRDGARPPRTKDGAGHQVSLPILGGGHTPIETELEIADGASAAHLVHAHVRGETVVLVLAQLR